MNRQQKIMSAILNRRQKYGLKEMWVSYRLTKYLPWELRRNYHIEIYKDKEELRDIVKYNLEAARLFPDISQERDRVAYCLLTKEAYHL